MNKFFSIIPARIGSKGIPKKNLYPLSGKPLIQWTIESSLSSKYISNTVISSNSDEVLNLASLFGATSHKRNELLSNDVARSEAVVKNVLEELEYLQNDFDYLILLQPTSPLRTFKHVDYACKKIIESQCDSLISVKETPNGILKTLIENGQGGLKTGFNKDFPFMPRQELPKAYMPNGAIYISKISSFIKTGSFMSTKNTFIVMDDFSSQDIDTIEDLNTVEGFLKSSESD